MSVIGDRRLGDLTARVSEKVPSARRALPCPASRDGATGWVRSGNSPANIVYGSKPTALAFAVVLVLAATAHFMVRSAEDKVTDRMLSQAERFAIPADWKLTDEIVRPERFMCISTNPCPSLSRRWEAGKELTDADVAALTSGLGFTMTTDHPCERDAKVIGAGIIAFSLARTASSDTGSLSRVLVRENPSSSR